MSYTSLTECIKGEIVINGQKRLAADGARDEVLCGHLQGFLLRCQKGMDQSVFEKEKMLKEGVESKFVGSVDGLGRSNCAFLIWLVSLSTAGC
jgi:hypothetical protein